MAKRKTSVLSDLTTAQLKRLLAARERIDVLESEKNRLLKELAGVDKELARLEAGAPVAKGKPGPKKKTAKKKAAKKKTTKKKVTKKTAGKTVRKTVKKAGRGKTAGRKSVSKSVGGRVPLEDVIVAALKKAGGQASFKDLLAAIVDGKLYKSKAARFDNVLRRTLSTSKKIRRVGRGVYSAA